MSNILVTIIVPVYNVEKYLKECLESIVSQKYKSLEIIAINDGSTDLSLEILNSYKKVFKNYKIITQRNKGLGAARNVGIEHMKGKYTYFLDSDDYILPDTIINLVELAEKNKLDLIRFDAAPFIEEGFDYQVNKNIYNSNNFFSCGMIYDNKKFILANFKGFRSSVCLYFIKSSIIKANNLRFKDIKHEDELFISILLKYCYKIMYDSTQYFQRRYRLNSIMTSNIMNSIESFDSLVVIIHELEKASAEKGISYYYVNFLKKKSWQLYQQLLLYNINENYKKSIISILQQKYKFKYSTAWMNFNKFKEIIKIYLYKKSSSGKR